MGPGGPPKMIIGSNTYHQVQARLTNVDDVPDKPTELEEPPDDPVDPVDDTVGPPPKPPPLQIAFGECIYYFTSYQFYFLHSGDKLYGWWHLKTFAMVFTNLFLLLSILCDYS